MSETRRIPMAPLARALGINERTAARWCESRLVPSINSGAGRGHGRTLSRDAALELCALAVLRRTGTPLKELGRIARGLRSEGKGGPQFLALGSDGSTVLMDGLGDDVPLRDQRGQFVLFAVLDLRRLRPQLEALVDGLAESSE